MNSSGYPSLSSTSITSLPRTVSGHPRCPYVLKCARCDCDRKRFARFLINKTSDLAVFSRFSQKPTPMTPLLLVSGVDVRVILPDEFIGEVPFLCQLVSRVVAGVPLVVIPGSAGVHSGPMPKVIKPASC